MAERSNSRSSSRSTNSSVFANSCTSSYKNSEDLDYFEVSDDISIRPPSGTNHQQPGSHLSVDTRLEQLSLESVSWIAKSEREACRQRRGDARGSACSLNQQDGRAQQRYKVVAQKPNCYIASPFKQGPETKKTGPVMVIDPSHELKQQTMARVKKTKEKLKSARQPRAPMSQSSQLIKGKLRHMGRPMTASGPQIDQCRGIFAGSGRYNISNPGRRFAFDDPSVKPNKRYSRTATPSSRARSPTELLRPESSIHLNSCASSDVDSNCDCLDSNGDCSTENSDSVDGDSCLIGGLARPVRDDDSKCESHEQLTRDAHTENNREDLVKNPQRCKPRECGYTRTWNGGGGDDDDCGSGRSGGNAMRSRNLHSYGDSSSGGSNQNKCVETSNSGKNGNSVTNGGQQTKMKMDISRFCCDSDAERGGHRNVTGRCGVNLTKDDNVYIQDSSRAAISEYMIKSNVWDSVSDSDAPVMEVNAKRTASKATDNSPMTPTASDATKSGCVEATQIDLVDGDELDPDRIPSAFLWKTLDTLTLSSADLDTDLNASKFRLKNRSVKSAGSSRHPGLNSQSKRKSKKPNSSRLRSGKLNEDAKGELTDIDGKERFSEFSRVLLGKNDGSKLAKTLPGYFSEQYKNILIQQRKGVENSDDSSNNHECSLEKFESEEETEVVNKKGEGGRICEQFPDSDNEEEEREEARLDRISQEVDKESCNEGIVNELQGDSGVETTSQLTEISSFTEFTEGAGTSCLDDGSDCKVTSKTTNTDKRDEEASDLRVVASAKHLSEPRYMKQKKSLTPFPPVCFSINAQPPTGSVYYFAYGADMNPKRMAIYLRSESKSRLWGVLFGFRLCFNKKGNSAEAGGFPNVQFSPADSVEGCVYTISELELSMLDNCVGYPKHYTRAVFPVWMLNCKDPSMHGVAQYCVPAVIYIAQDEWLVHGNEDFLDCTFSVNQCLKAQDILSPNYVRFLSSLVA